MNRIAGFDVARSVAVILAMTSHALYEFGVDVDWRIVLRLATPTFIILFGVVLEIVYLRMMREGRQATVTRRLLVRAVQCAVLHGLAAVVLALSEGYSVAYTVRMVLFLGSTPYTDILKFYAIILTLAPLILWARMRFGLFPLAILALAAHPVLAAIEWPSADPNSLGSQLLGLMVGAPGKTPGPSIVHSLLFVVFGMTLGALSVRWSLRHALLGASRPAGMAAFAVLAVVLAVRMAQYEGPLLNDLGGMTLRNANAFLYFLFGMVGAVVIFDGAMRLSAVLRRRVLAIVSIPSRTSLFVFFAGNTFLYLLHGEHLNSAVLALAALGAIMAMAVAQVRIGEWARVNDGPAARTYRFATVGYAQRLIDGFLGTVQFFASRAPSAIVRRQG